ncbi:MAG: S9 family peptidase [Ktedonobacteraceae bacterium]
MTPQHIAPYGSWKSPITPELITSASIRFSMTAIDGQNTYWIERRASEGGRNVLVHRAADGTISDLTPQPFNVRTSVHEYGGGDYVVSNGTVYFSNFADQRIYRMTPEIAPEPITPEVNMRYADYIVDQRRNRLICVREDHTDTTREAVNTLVSVALDGSGQVVELVAGNNFYSTPRLSPDEAQLAWLTWKHPNMPWDSTELWVGDIVDGQVVTGRRVAGGPRESIFQPIWSPDGILHFVSDRSGWWNLYRLHEGAYQALCPREAEFGMPQWVFGMSTYGFTSPERIICRYRQHGNDSLASLDTTTGVLTPFHLPYSVIENVRVANKHVVFTAAAPDMPEAIVQLDLDTSTVEVIRSSSTITLDSAYFSMPHAIEFPTEQDRTAFAFFYPPRNPDFVAPSEELPPLLVMSHGGPTSATTSAFNSEIQYWTSRGFAVLDVNYGGSTGYGRAYRERLHGQWGVVDVDDCINGANYLVKRGDVDGNKLAITGGSAGGYTTLCALTFRDTFKVGASYYGIGDIESLLADGHKFESHYDSTLIGPYPEARELYHQRSPIYSTDRLSAPVIFFQGSDDKVVTPNQAERMVAALRAKKVPVAYILFEGEGHGFRRAENIQRSLEAELYFYSKVLGFELADTVMPVEIENM